MSLNSRLDKRFINPCILFFLCCFLGIILRFLAMEMGHNYDFESYLIVGDIINQGGNVYAETTRYNYGFIFFLLQGLGFKLASLFPEVLTGLFRVYIVSLLTVTDLGITLLLARKYSYKVALFFFLNPIAIVITGYHNQFDNIAILLALLAMSFFDKNYSVSKKDLIVVFFFTLSLIVKHIMAFFFIWLLINRNFPNWKKRILYSCAPPVLFLLSFAPFCIHNKAALDGVINNVFLYRSYNNYPLLSNLLEMLGVPEKTYFVIFIILIITVGTISRTMDFDDQILLYFVSLVAFSSAVANQYLAIPLAALSIYDRKIFYWLYTVLGAVYCVLNGNEFHLAERFIHNFPSASAQIDCLASEGGMTVSIMMFILLLFIIMFIIDKRKSKENEINKNF